MPRKRNVYLSPDPLPRLATGNKRQLLDGGIDPEALKTLNTVEIKDEKDKTFLDEFARQKAVGLDDDQAKSETIKNIGREQRTVKKNKTELDIDLVKKSTDRIDNQFQLVTQNQGNADVAAAAQIAALLKKVDDIPLQQQQLVASEMRRAQIPHTFDEFKFDYEIIGSDEFTSLDNAAIYKIYLISRAMYDKQRFAGVSGVQVVSAAFTAPVLNRVTNNYIQMSSARQTIAQAAKISNMRKNEHRSKSGNYRFLNLRDGSIIDGIQAFQLIDGGMHADEQVLKQLNYATLGKPLAPTVPNSPVLGPAPAPGPGPLPLPAP